jgi:hypothetical protein
MSDNPRLCTHKEVPEVASEREASRRCLVAAGGSHRAMMTGTLTMGKAPRTGSLSRRLGAPTARSGSWTERIFCQSGAFSCRFATSGLVTCRISSMSRAHDWFVARTRQPHSHGLPRHIGVETVHRKYNRWSIQTPETYSGAVLSELSLRSDGHAGTTTPRSFGSDTSLPPDVPDPEI